MDVLLTLLTIPVDQVVPRGSYISIAGEKGDE